MDMPSGRVKFFNTDRGYGFIAPDDGGSDVFVHVHDVEAAGMNILVAGQLVAYEVGPRGMAAQRPSIFARLTNIRNASLPSPVLGEGRHRGLSGGRIAVRRRAILMVPENALVGRSTAGPVTICSTSRSTRWLCAPCSARC
jgi:cold shock protein